MNLKCTIGMHAWTGCKCSQCGKTRIGEHDLSADWESGCKCARCGKTVNLPRFLLACSSCPPNQHFDIWHVAQYYFWVADFYMADVPEVFIGKDALAIYENNPMNKTPEQMVELAKSRWPDLAPSFPSLDVRAMALPSNLFGSGYACIVTKRRSPPPSDERYPHGYFPRRFAIHFFGSAPPDGMEEFLRKERYRYSGNTEKTIHVSVDSHAQMERLLAQLRSMPTRHGEPSVPSHPNLCPHGRFMDSDEVFKESCPCPECRMKAVTFLVNEKKGEGQGDSAR